MRLKMERSEKNNGVYSYNTTHHQPYTTLHTIHHPPFNHLWVKKLKTHFYKLEQINYNESTTRINY